MVVHTSYPSNRKVEYKGWEFSAVLTYSLAVDATWDQINEQQQKISTKQQQQQQKSLVFPRQPLYSRHYTNIFQI